MFLYIINFINKCLLSIHFIGTLEVSHTGILGEHNPSKVPVCLLSSILLSIKFSQCLHKSIMNTGDLKFDMLVTQLVSGCAVLFSVCTCMQHIVQNF